MDCKTARKYLHLFKDDELTDNEKTLLRNHLAECMECRALSEDLDIYEEVMKDIASQEPYLSNPGELTDTIMSGIQPGKTGLLENTLRLFSLPVLRIAATILILIQIGVFSYQHLYIANSTRKLKHITQYQDIQSGDSEAVYRECIEESRKIITDILGHDDPDFNRKAIKYSRKLSNEQIEDYAVQICRYSHRLQNTGNKKQKKQLLINIISNDLNIKINPEI